MTKRGPFVSENGPEVYLPVSDYTFNEARHEAAQMAAEMVGGWGRSRYTGKREIALHDHDGWSDECAVCSPEPTWCFETYEGTYRD